MPRLPRAARDPAQRPYCPLIYCAVSATGGFHSTAGKHAGGACGEGPPPPQIMGILWVPKAKPDCYGRDQCTGPLAPVLKALEQLLPVGWSYEGDPRQAGALARVPRIYRQRLAALPTYVPGLHGAPGGRMTAGGCCPCGAVGICWANGVDCRLLAERQRMLGQC